MVINNAVQSKISVGTLWEIQEKFSREHWIKLSTLKSGILTAVTDQIYHGDNYAAPNSSYHINLSCVKIIELFFFLKV